MIVIVIGVHRGPRFEGYFNGGQVGCLGGVGPGLGVGYHALEEISCFDPIWSG